MDVRRKKHLFLFYFSIFSIFLFCIRITPANAETDFITKRGVDLATGYKAKWISQSQSGSTDQFFRAIPGGVIEFEAVFENVGEKVWYNADAKQITFAIYKDPKVTSAPKALGYDNSQDTLNFGKSYFRHPEWVTEYRVGTLVEPIVKPGERGTIKMKFKIPDDATAGSYREDISMAAGPYWIENTANGDPFGIAHIWIGITVLNNTPEAVTKIGKLYWVNYGLQDQNGKRLDIKTDYGMVGGVSDVSFNKQYLLIEGLRKPAGFDVVSDGMYVYDVDTGETRKIRELSGVGKTIVDGKFARTTDTLAVVTTTDELLLIDYPTKQVKKSISLAKYNDNVGGKVVWNSNDTRLAVNHTQWLPDNSHRETWLLVTPDSNAIEELSYTTPLATVFAEVSVPTIDDSGAIGQYPVPDHRFRSLEDFLGKDYSQTSLRLPFANGKIYKCTQGYDWTIYNHPPVNGVLQASHHGYQIDFAMPAGDSVVAAAGGVIEKTGSNPLSYGNYVVVRHTVENKTFKTYYFHLSSVSDSLKQEMTPVRIGQEIAKSGNTGNSTGAHLHFEMTDRDRFEKIRAIRTAGIQHVGNEALSPIAYFWTERASYEAVGSSTSTTPTPSARFSVGQTVTSLVIDPPEGLNIRSAAGLSAAPTGKRAVKGEKGVVVAGPVSVDGMNWYKIDWVNAALPTGWSADNVGGVNTLE
ncbi:MAG: M23 family metallopeptidase [bacterium]